LPKLGEPGNMALSDGGDSYKGVRASLESFSPPVSLGTSRRHAVEITNGAGLKTQSIPETKNGGGECVLKTSTALSGLSRKLALRKGSISTE